VQAAHRQAGQPEDRPGPQANAATGPPFQLQFAGLEENEGVAPARFVEGAAGPGSQRDHPALESRGETAVEEGQRLRIVIVELPSSITQMKERRAAGP